MLLYEITIAPKNMYREKNLYEVNQELGAGVLRPSACPEVENRPLGKTKIANPRGMPGRGGESMLTGQSETCIN